MPSFDVLDLATPLFGAKLLEASAGTGKTFAIEHLFVRLLLEAPPYEEPLILEQILAITFTRAAAREMRMRIRANIEKALEQLKQQEPAWPYLLPHARSVASKRRLEDALLGFDRAQIFTIHGFCQRLLTHYALEARVSISDQSEESFTQSIQPRLLDFLQEQQILCPEQLGRLLSKRRSIESLCDALINAPNPSLGASFASDCLAFQQAMKRCPHNPRLDEVRLDFEKMKPNYKITGFKEASFDEQIICLVNIFHRIDEEASLRRLIFCQGSLLDFLSPSNRKLRIKEDYRSPFLEWCAEHLQALLQTFFDPKRLLSNLRFAWQKELEMWIEEKGLFSPDFLLSSMKDALEQPQFLARIQQKYRAAIVDEFQDTDALQWSIFRKIFFENQRLFYLVGDPKQSIYRFRQADLYTYFQARRTLGDQSHYSLDTNYRSTPELISALNDLFGDEQVEPWLWLPREKRSESYRPIKAGSGQQWNPHDGKQPLHFFCAEELGEAVFAYIAQEIVRLKDRVSSYGSFAVLVKDRMQAFEVQTYLQKQSLPCWAKSQSPLDRSFAFHALEEFFEALYFPRDASRLKVFLSGPFADYSSEQLMEEGLFIPELATWKALLDREGLPSLFRSFLGARLNGRTVYERIKQRGSSFFSDLFQMIEQLLSIRSLSLESIQRFFRELEASDPDEETAARRRADNDVDAIQILTMHASKGLEFDIVFVLGAAASTPRETEDLEEVEAEKMRQLYVALTRARWRIYLPLIAKKRTWEGSESPLNLFWRRSKLGQNPYEIVEKLIAKNSNISLEMTVAIQPLVVTAPPPPKLLAPPSLSFEVARRKVFSYSALSHGESHSSPAAAILPSEEKNLHTLPRGSETGVVLHRIMERILKKNGDISKIVHEELFFSALKEWIAPVQEMAEKALLMPIMEGGGSLRDFVRKKSEVEFFFDHVNQCVKGFIDLVFIWNDRIYFIDWKTNWLGENDSSYVEPRLRQAMDEGDYWFQASLYADAIQRAWPQIQFGGALYLFLRGVHAANHGVLSFQPPPISLDQRIWKS